MIGKPLQYTRKLTMRLEGSYTVHQEFAVPVDMRPTFENGWVKFSEANGTQYFINERFLRWMQLHPTISVPSPLPADPLSDTLEGQEEE